MTQHFFLLLVPIGILVTLSPWFEGIKIAGSEFPLKNQLNVLGKIVATLFGLILISGAALFSNPKRIEQAAAFINERTLIYLKTLAGERVGYAPVCLMYIVPSRKGETYTLHWNVVDSSATWVNVYINDTKVETSDSATYTFSNRRLFEDFSMFAESRFGNCREYARVDKIIFQSDSSP